MPKVPVVATLSKGRLGRRAVISANGMATDEGDDLGDDDQFEVDGPSVGDDVA